MLVLVLLLLLSLSIIVLGASSWRAPSNVASMVLALCVLGVCIWDIVARSRGH